MPTTPRVSVPERPLSLKHLVQDCININTRVPYAFLRAAGIALHELLNARDARSFQKNATLYEQFTDAALSAGGHARELRKKKSSLKISLPDSKSATAFNELHSAIEAAKEHCTLVMCDDSSENTVIRNAENLLELSPRIMFPLPR